jgi:hypothetical protein
MTASKIAGMAQYLKFPLSVSYITDNTSNFDCQYFGFVQGFAQLIQTHYVWSTNLIVPLEGATRTDRSNRGQSALNASPSGGG